MKTSGGKLIPRIACCLAVSLLTPFVFAAASPLQDQSAGSGVATQSTNADHSQQNSRPAQSQVQGFPDSPGSTRSQVAENASPFGGQQSLTAQQQDQEPVGTAAAAGVETTGIAASKPAGAAIAPAKQRRTRSFLIKVSAIVGASVAVGTVVALANASPSRPPGAR
jgi:hypothetical protein